MQISLIAALDKHGAIGKEGRIPWHLPADMRYFRRKTAGKSIIMGRKTYISIGKPLPKRHNIVLTRSADFRAPGCTVAHDVTGALNAASGSEVMIIGGGEIYKLFLPLADRLYLTFVEVSLKGDTYFPTVDPAHWTTTRIVGRQADGHNPYRYRFAVLDRREPRTQS
jgi:dihydrofolate reductase